MCSLRFLLFVFTFSKWIVFDFTIDDSHQRKAFIVKINFQETKIGCKNVSDESLLWNHFNIESFKK